MKTKKDNSGINMVKPTSFYSNEIEKTKFNWFCYELSVGIYDEVMKNHGKQLQKHKIGEKALVEFSNSTSKKIKGIISQKLSGKIDKVYFSHELIESHFPFLSDELINKMLDAISEAWDKQLSLCEICPTRCISEKDAYCTMFDDGPF